MVADERVNVDNAVDIGEKILKDMDGKSVSAYSFKKVAQATTFAVLRKPVKSDNGEDIHMSSTQLYQRLFAIASCSVQQTVVCSPMNLKL